MEARLRVVQPVKGTSRFRQEWMFGFRFFGLRRKLQHDRALAFAKMREQHDLSVGKFQRIMVRARLVHVHLPESGDRVRQRPGPPEQKLASFQLLRHRRNEPQALLYGLRPTGAERRGPA